MSDLMIRLYYWAWYRPFMKFAHRHGWHHMKHLVPYPPHTEYPHGILKCDWCGIHSDVPWSMKMGFVSNPPKEGSE